MGMHAGHKAYIGDNKQHRILPLPLPGPPAVLRALITSIDERTHNADRHTREMKILSKTSWFYV